MDFLVRHGYWFLIPLVFLYIISMLIIPWIDGGFQWSYVQRVWFDWQAFNVGCLAFISSVIAFYISRYNSEQQRKREFISSKAFLPHALSELNDYLKKSGEVLCVVFQRTSEKDNIVRDVKIPLLPAEYANTFKECIRHSRAHEGEYLAHILVLLQIHNSRLQTIQSERGVNNLYCMSCLYHLAELQVLINNLFDFARNEKDTIATDKSWESFSIAFRNLGIIVDNFDGVEHYVKKQLNKNA